MGPPPELHLIQRHETETERAKDPSCMRTSQRLASAKHRLVPSNPERETMVFYSHPSTWTECGEPGSSLSAYLPRTDEPYTVDELLYCFFRWSLEMRPSGAETPLLAKPQRCWSCRPSGPPQTRPHWRFLSSLESSSAHLAPGAPRTWQRRRRQWALSGYIMFRSPTGR